MNVLHICDFASPISGNFMAELNSVDSVLRKDGTGKNIYVLTDRNLERKNKWVDELKKEHPVYIYEKNPLKKIRLFRKLIKTEKADIIHVHFTDMKTDICIRFAALGKKVSVVKHYRSGYGHFSRAKINIGRLVYKKWMFICISPAMIEECGFNYPMCKSRLVLNPIAFERLDSYENLTKKDIIGSDDGILCFMLGYNYKLKGIDIAAEAVSGLREKFNACLAVCVTTNIEKITEELKNQFGGEMPDWIKLLPPRKDIASYYRAADVCLSPSRSEGACSAIVEEAYCGKPVAASNCPGQFSYINGKLDILWFENRNPADLEVKIEEALKLKEDEKLIESNKENAVKYYGLDTYTKQITEIYKVL